MNTVLQIEIPEETPNDECYEALMELRSGGGTKFDSVEEFFKVLGL